MPDKHAEADAMREDVPSTVARSDDKAVRTFKKTLESAEDSYGEGERAQRTAFASLKHTHEKVGDHWEPKEHKGPSDARAALSTPESRDDDLPTAQGVDANASKKHLVGVARRLGISHPERSTKKQLVEDIQRANARETERARRERRKLQRPAPEIAPNAGLPRSAGGNFPVCPHRPQPTPGHRPPTS